MTCDCDFMLPTKEGWEIHYDNCRTKWKTNERLRDESGVIILQNPHTRNLDVDVLYHLGLDTKNYDLPTMFGDVKFVCMGGTKHRMREFANHMTKVLGIQEEKLFNLTKHSRRYAMFKVGPVLSVSHGIGVPSMTILLQEVIKLLHYAMAIQPIIVRIGSSGGLGLEPGSVVVSSFALNGYLKREFEIPVLGKRCSWPSEFDKRLCQEMGEQVSDDDGFTTVIGGTMCADDFYRGQARLDGPFCSHSNQDKMAFLKSLHQAGVRNIEMEATALAALCTQAGVRAADLCVTLLDRLKGDQVTTSKQVMMEWEKRPMLIVGRYIAKYCEHLKIKK